MFSLKSLYLRMRIDEVDFSLVKLYRCIIFIEFFYIHVGEHFTLFLLIV